MMSAGERLQHGLERFFALRQHGEDLPFNMRLENLQAYQRERLLKTHANLINDPKTEPAARFLIEDVYGGRDLKPVAIDIRRAVNKAQRLLPRRVMDTSATVLEAAILTQELDEALTDTLAERLDLPLDDDVWCWGYRQQGQPELRGKQLEVIRQIGPHLDRYVRSRMIQSTFRLVRKPAHAAGFGNLYDFLELGFGAMKGIDRCDTLLDRLATIEQHIMQQVLDEHPRPYEVRSL
jgi:hypothetical protein